MLPNRISRRRFGQAASAAWAVTLVPRHAVADSGQTPPSEKLNIASIGIGGMGAGDVAAVGKDNNIVALCDVDLRRAGGMIQKFSQAKLYRDFRRMFDEVEGKIDAVTVSTPDHTHAVAAMAAITRGKHVYCQKPLAHSVAEVRALMKAAKEHKVVTQLGNQGHSTDTIRTFCEWIWDGAIGKVHTVHAGCRAVNSAIDRLPQLAERPAVPAELEWNLWLGPAAERPYSPAYLPGAWRGWVPFGNGTVGDWVCHVVDPVFWAFDLGAPATIQADVEDYDPKSQADAYPKGERITYEFAAKGERGPITLHWYSGTRPIPRPADLEPEREPVAIGAVVLGDAGTITYGSHGAGGVRLIPEPKMQAYKKPEPSLPRAKEHHEDWIQAIRTGGKAGSDFAYGGPLTEIALLGVIAIKLAGQKLAWNGERFTNSDAANVLLDPPYRSGWKL